jgi:hypothetical protein
MHNREKAMNWDAVGAIGEIVGAASVVVTLVYLARQISNSNAVSAAHVYQERANTRMTMHQFQSDSDHLAPIMFRLDEQGWPDNVEALNELDGLELHRFRQNQFASIVRFDNSYYQYRHGFLDEDAWELTKVGIRKMAPTWKRLGILESGATRPFREEIERVLK